MKQSPPPCCWKPTTSQGFGAGRGQELLPAPQSSWSIRPMQQRCQHLLMLPSAPQHRQGSNCWSHQPFLLGRGGSWVLPSPPLPTGARMLGEGCRISGRQAVPTFKAPNSLSSFGGLGKQKDFSAAREALEAAKATGAGEGAGGLILSIPSSFQCWRCKPWGEDAPLAPHPGWVAPG